MITFTKFGSLGNLGNQLFQYASLLGFREKYFNDVVLPEWKYSEFFADPPISYGKSNPWQTIQVKEKSFHYTPEYWDKEIPTSPDVRVYDIIGWLQSEKYWEHCKDLVKEKLKFTQSFKDALRAKQEGTLQTLDIWCKKTIAISIRRGDYVDNPNYELLPINYYLHALYEHFPDWKDYELVVFSDDIDYCKVHFDCVDGVTFAEGFSDIEQLCMMSQCDHFIIANSTFSWWGAYLGEKEHSKIIRPTHHFAGNLLKTSDSKDFYPDRWTCFDHKGKKFDLKDVTFTIPVCYDHNDRRQNLELSVCMLQRDFETNIIVHEQGQRPQLEFMSQYCSYDHYTDHSFFHRTHILNKMARLANTAIVVNWDADVIVPPLQLLQAVEMIRSGQADMVYPYDGRFARVNRATWFKKIEKYLDAGMFGNHVFPGTNKLDTRSVGGAILFNKEKFIEGGMENENMKSYGPEDQERYHRFLTLGYKISKIPGMIYHMDHWRGSDSSSRNKYFAANNAEFQKISIMSMPDLAKYLNSWPWKKINPFVKDINDHRLDIVIPLGTGSSWKNNELRYCLRSIQKFLTGFRNIYIIGEDPGFLNDEIRIIRLPDQSQYNRAKNIYTKLMHACKQEAISDTFSYWNDDYLLMKPLDVKGIPNYTKGELLPASNQLPAGDTFRVCLHNTYTALKKKGFATTHYDVHFPMNINKKMFAQVMPKYDWHVPYGYTAKSLYANTLRLPGNQTNDCKITSQLTGGALDQEIRGRILFSYGDGALNQNLKSFIQERFPDPLQWEK